MDEGNKFADTLIEMMDKIHIDDHNEVDFGALYEQCDRCGQYIGSNVMEVYWFYDTWKQVILQCDEAHKVRLQNSWTQLKNRSLKRELVF